MVKGITVLSLHPAPVFLGKAYDSVPFPQSYCAISRSPLSEITKQGKGVRKLRQERDFLETQRGKALILASQYHRDALIRFTEIHKPERPSSPSVAGRGRVADKASFLGRSTYLRCGHYRAAQRYNRSRKLSGPVGSARG